MHRPPAVRRLWGCAWVLARGQDCAQNCRGIRCVWAWDFSEDEPNQDKPGEAGASVAPAPRFSLDRSGSG